MIDKLDLYISGGMGDAKYRQQLRHMYVCVCAYVCVHACVHVCVVSQSIMAMLMHSKALKLTVSAPPSQTG